MIEEEELAEKVTAEFPALNEVFPHIVITMNPVHFSNTCDNDGIRAKNANVNVENVNGTSMNDNDSGSK